LKRAISCGGGHAKGARRRSRRPGADGDNGNKQQRHEFIPISADVSFFINRPIVAIVIAILQVVVGLVTMLGLPVAQYPNIVPPEIRIQTTYVGAGRTNFGPISGHTHRGADERRGRHELHVFRQRQ